MPHSNRVKRLYANLNDKFRLNESYRAVFDNPHGEVVLRHLIKVGYVFTPTYVQGDPTESAHREGMRRLVLSVIRQLKITDTELLEMEKEYE